MVLVDGQPPVGVQLAPNHVAPDWPDGTPQQIHLDLWVDGRVHPRPPCAQKRLRNHRSARDGGSAKPHVDTRHQSTQAALGSVATP